MDDEDTFSRGECKTDLERALTLALNARAEPWIKGGACLIGPFAKEESDASLVFFVDPPDGQLIRVDLHKGKALVGFDLTGQGGPDLDPRASEVAVFKIEDDDPEPLADAIAEHLDALLARLADAEYRRAARKLTPWWRRV